VGPPSAYGIAWSRSHWRAPGAEVILEIGLLWFGVPTSKLTVIDKRTPEGAVITRLVAHDGRLCVGPHH